MGDLCGCGLRVHVDTRLPYVNNVRCDKSCRDPKYRTGLLGFHF